LVKRFWRHHQIIMRFCCVNLSRVRGGYPLRFLGSQRREQFCGGPTWVGVRIRAKKGNKPGY
jgi:hypothetical protein